MASLYRKHRPRTFADVVGQEHIVRTLQAAVEQDRVAHAYLFAGPRGTGKTSLAKILAKALNCEHGPTPTPDGTCERCMAIHEARSLDVIELDAASNRGIDTIRETVIERASLAPIEGGRKIYILDEAHSLTADASNALLKTLEEPPEKVVFILCTTDAGKLLPTVRSRCQRFAFRRPGPGELATVLRRIADAEQIEVADAALHLMARAAGGSFRDAVGTLDQLSTVTHGQISADEAARVLGLVPEQALSDLVDLIADGDTGGVLRRIDELAAGGQDLSGLVPALLDRLRLLYLLQHAGELPASAEPPPDRLEDLRRQSRALPPGETVRTIDLLVVAQSELREGSDPRLSLELALLKATRPAAAGRDLLLARVERLEAALARRRAARPRPQPSPRPRPSRASSAAPAPEAPARGAAHDLGARAHAGRRARRADERRACRPRRAARVLARSAEAPRPCCPRRPRPELAVRPERSGADRARAGLDAGRRAPLRRAARARRRGGVRRTGRADVHRGAGRAPARAGERCR